MRSGNNSYRNLKSNKTGNDGLPVEFYKTFNEILEADLHKLYIEISQLKEMPRSIRQVVSFLSFFCKDFT